jgi:hypothetical protein
MELAQDRVQWQALVLATLNLWGSKSITQGSSPALWSGYAQLPLSLSRLF